MHTPAEAVDEPEAQSHRLGDHLAEWTHQGYRSHWARPTKGTANVITPPSTVAAFRAGYPVQIDDAAR